MKKRWIGLLGEIVGLVLVLTVLVPAVRKFICYIPYMNVPPVTIKQLDEFNLDKYNKLMIVAHPDDETLWGGRGLIEDDYFVLCITNGNNKVRSDEFQKVMRETGDVGLILSYPDKINGVKSDWKYWKDHIQMDIETILDYKDWEVVVTHNAQGEYGHIQHIMLHDLEVAAYDAVDCRAQQYFFGKYYRKKQLSKLDLEEQVTGDKLDKKYELINIYKSQETTLNKLSHMAPYENWTKAD